ncbi:MAG: RDD family protein [Candidatus Dormibacteraceae bacterium]
MISRIPSGRELRDGYLRDIQELTLGLVRAHGNSLYVGPLELLRFGTARVTESGVEWPIEAGLLVRAPGGHLRFEVAGNQVVASVDGYRPLLPLPIYALTQLPVHRLMTRLYLLRVRGREPAPGVPANRDNRMRAAAVDAALCLTLSRVAGRQTRLRTLLGLAAVYHVACWSISGRTLGGLVQRQRVVAVDGSQPTVTQSVVRLVTLPLAWITRRPIHDELAGTDVIVD